MSKENKRLQINIRMDGREELLERVRQQCDREGINISAFVIRCIELVLEQGFSKPAPTPPTLSGDDLSERVRDLEEQFEDLKAGLVEIARAAPDIDVEVIAATEPVLTDEPVAPTPPKETTLAGFDLVLKPGQLRIFTVEGDAYLWFENGYKKWRSDLTVKNWSRYKNRSKEWHLNNLKNDDCRLEFAILSRLHLREQGLGLV